MPKTTAIAQNFVVQVALLLAVIAVNSADAAGPAAGTNVGDYSLLCEAINLASAAVPEHSLPTVDGRHEDAAALINLTLHNPNALAELASADSPAAAIAKENSAAAAACAGDNKVICEKAAERYKKHKHDKLYVKVAGKDFPETAKHALAKLAMDMLNTGRELRLAVTRAQSTEVKKKLNTAIAGTDTGVFTLAAGASDRKTACGQPSTTEAGKIAGSSLTADILCICGKDNSQDTDNVCGVSVTSDGVITWNSNTNADNQAATLTKNCKKTPPATKAEPAAIQKVVAAIRTRAAAGKASGANKPNLLGHLNGVGGGDCTGADSAGAGACVYYGNADDAVTKIKWTTELEETADLLTQQAMAAAQAQALAQKLDTLNSTMTAIALMAATPTATTINAARPKLETNTIAECTQISKATVCKAKGECQWEGGEKTDGPHCKLNETKVEQTVAGAPTREGTIATVCEKHKTDKNACDKDNNCKLEENKCKDSSFLITKKLPLISASFIGFVAFKLNFLKFMKLAILRELSKYDNI
ncbi:Trypanosomal VSG domain [Trypanosoma brucei equiperdum]|uniref:Trypanosomal VSG domain n=1 Tax=Trypanosoma brucei equiperdum TaxID=630700 RepID=A0A3L6KS31_9TRYP|nr:Trypanosomal VSG domain [Trypanosoma brucei equiperdum]